MKVMSHNSWSFLTPKSLFQKLINFTAKCQAVSIQEQYEEYDVRIFDLRVKLDSDNKITIAHGLVSYKDSIRHIITDLAYLNNKPDVYVRVFLEIRFACKDTEYQRIWFTNYCRYLETNYPNIKFCGGYPTYNTTVPYYKFKHNLPATVANHASYTTKNVLDDLWPWLYAKRHNKKAVEDYIKSGTDKYLSIDFVNIR